MNLTYVLLGVIATLVIALIFVLCFKSGNGSRVVQAGAQNVLLQKLTSRKLWAAIIGFATTVVTAFYSDDLTQEQLDTVKVGIVLLGTFILGEGYADGHSPTNKADTIIEQEKTSESNIDD